MSLCRLVILGMLIGCGGVHAQEVAPSRASLAEAAARRFPQPVRVGELLGRRVLQPIVSRPTLGRVRDVVRRADGTLDMVLDYGGLLGFFARPIAVPAEAMALLGQDMVAVGLTPEQLERLETFDSTGATPLPPDSVIRLGLTGPYH